MSHAASSPDNNLTQELLYKKALEIFSLSRHLASYISNDKDILEMGSSSKSVDKYSMHLVMDSLSLAPSIASTHSHFDLRLRKISVFTLRKTVKRLLLYCEYLEKNYTQGRDYISLLKKELAQFKKYRTRWEAMILQKN